VPDSEQDHGAETPRNSTEAGKPAWPTEPPPHKSLGPKDPTTVGRYRLEAKLGEGGMGRVYLGRTPAGRAIAVKVVREELAADWAFRKRFEQEVATAKRVQGLYTVPVVDADVRASEPWLATAYVPGPPLDYVLVEHGPLATEATLMLIAGVAEALQSVHDTGVVHRDLKPSNVILTAEGPKVIDFGIARAADVTSFTSAGTVPGTPAYMAPEYIQGNTATPATDIFALGVIASYAATGRTAFGGGSGHAVVHRILAQEPDLSDCPDSIRAIASACLHKEPDQRPTPEAVILACQKALDGEEPFPTTAIPAHAPETAIVAADPTVNLGEPSTVLNISPSAPRVIAAQAQDQANEGSRISRRAILGAIGGVVAIAGIGVAVDALLRSSGPRQVARLLGHANGVDRVVFSPNGTTMATAGVDHTVRLWDVASRQQLATLTGHTDAVHGVTFSWDGRLVASAGQDAQVRLWEVASRQEYAMFTGPGGQAVFDVVFSPDGRTLAFASADGTVTLRDLVNRDKSATVVGHTSTVTSVAYSPNGQVLASASADGTVRLANTATQRQFVALVRHSGPVTSTAVNRNGDLIVSGGYDNTVRLWEVASHEQITVLNGHTGPVIAVAFSPDGEKIASASQDNTVRLWETAGREEIATLTDAPNAVNGIAFSPDGRTLATAESDGSVRLWEID
jgi:WD40 repeat protein